MKTTRSCRCPTTAPASRKRSASGSSSCSTDRTGPPAPPEASASGSRSPVSWSITSTERSASTKRLAAEPASASPSRSCRIRWTRRGPSQASPRARAEGKAVSNRRDQLIAFGAASIVIILALSVVTAVLSAERNGRHALEDLQLAQLEQLARVLDGAFAPALTSKVGIINPSTGMAWTMVPGDATDRAGLERLQSAQPTARTGYVLVSMDGTVTNGTLLTDPKAIGTKLQRPGMEMVLAGTPAVLPVSEASLTTPLP